MEKLTKSEFVKKCLKYKAEKAMKKQRLLEDYFYERAKRIRERKRRALQI